MKKVVLKLDLHHDKEKQKAMKMVSSLTGIDSMTMDMKERKLTVVGDIDPVQAVKKLRKVWHTEILSIGPANEPPIKQDEGGKKDDNNKKDPNELYQFNPHMTTHYHVQSLEENPNACVIC